MYLASQDPETWYLKELIKKKLKGHSWSNYGWKTIRLLWYFRTFHEKEEGVLFNIRFLQPTQTILEDVPFIYALTNTNLDGI